MHLPDLFAQLPGLRDKQTDDEPTELESKRDRIKFHREKVRNGPVKFREPSSGQVRRFQARSLKSMQRKGYRRQVKGHLAAQREGMILRGMLQSTGVLDYVLPISHLRPEAALAGITWIVERFADDRAADENGRIEVTEDVVRQSLQSALNRWQAIVGLPPTELSDDYVLPVQVATA
jgi:hypothetical protein